MNYYKGLNTVPPGGWFWVCPDTGRRIEGPSLGVLKARIEDFWVANKIKMRPGLPQEIVDQLCARAPEVCGSTEPPTFADRVRSFSRAVTGFSQGGVGVAAPEVIAEREAACHACELYRGDRGLGFVSCGKCGCTSIKLWIPSEVCPHPAGSRWTKSQ
jgi:hypothetical protein